MTILGIDPGLTKTGFGLISVSKDTPKIIDFGIIQPNNNDTLSKRLYTIYTDMEELIATFSPTVLSIEDVIANTSSGGGIIGSSKGPASILLPKRFKSIE